MKRLYLTVEGQTEQAFAVQILQPHLATFNVFVTKPRLTGPHGRRNGRIPQGGMFFTFQHVLADIKRWLREDTSAEARFSMMVDLYGLPHDVPGYTEPRLLADPYDRAVACEKALAICVNDPRFIPYVQVHEFEALWLAAPEKFAAQFESREREMAQLQAECAAFASPELINHDPQTHPKARILKYFADYQPRVDGPRLAQEIGLAHIRQCCPHFNAWLTMLEHLDKATAG